jgi:3,4-dihydroxy-2-butanone 4-phosphate synthase
MAKVGMKLGFTFRLGPKDMNQYAKIDIDVSEVDTDISFEDQVETIDKTMDKTYKHLRSFVDKKIEEILDE